MAKPPVPGKVKTRLCADGRLTSDQAAAVHRAMLVCVLDRLASLECRNSLRFVLSYDQSLVSADDRVSRALDMTEKNTDDWYRFIAQPWQIVEQGSGDLGERMSRIWTSFDGPVLFFGADTPDAPRETLAWMIDQLRDVPKSKHESNPDAPNWIGLAGVADGGYWTLGAPEQAPGVLRGIDWGTGSVYHQTQQAAQRCGLHCVDWPRWHDVDHPEDLADLMDRLDAAPTETRAALTIEPALVRLRQELRRIVGDSLATSR